MATHGPIWESDLLLPSLPSPSGKGPKPPILPLSHLSIRGSRCLPLGLDDLTLDPGWPLDRKSTILFRGVVELERNTLRWVRQEAKVRLGGEEALMSATQGGRVLRVVVQGEWRMATFDHSASPSSLCPLSYSNSIQSCS
jgi:hypothetical protein